MLSKLQHPRLRSTLLVLQMAGVFSSKTTQLILELRGSLSAAGTETKLFFILTVLCDSPESTAIIPKQQGSLLAIHALLDQRTHKKNSLLRRALRPNLSACHALKIRNNTAIGSLLFTKHCILARATSNVLFSGGFLVI